MEEKTNQEQKLSHQEEYYKQALERRAARKETFSIIKFVAVCLVGAAAVIFLGVLMLQALNGGYLYYEDKDQINRKLEQFQRTLMSQEEEIQLLKQLPLTVPWVSTNATFIQPNSVTNLYYWCTNQALQWNATNEGVTWETNRVVLPEVNPYLLDNGRGAGWGSDTTEGSFVVHATASEDAAD